MVKSWLCHMWTVWPWAGCCLSLSLSFLLCKMGKMPLPLLTLEFL